jgi:hypothetical protein
MTYAVKSAVKSVVKPAVKSGAPGMLAACAVLLLAAAYLRYYLAAAPGMTMLQASAASCTPALLAEKRPIVIQDRVVRHEDLLTTVFRFQHLYASAREGLPPDPRPRRSRARFTVLFDPDRDVRVDVLHPDGDGGLVRVALGRAQALVLPPRWCYAAPDGARELRLYDSFHAVASWASS